MGLMTSSKGPCWCLMRYTLFNARQSSSSPSKLCWIGYTFQQGQHSPDRQCYSKAPTLNCDSSVCCICGYDADLPTRCWRLSHTAHHAACFWTILPEAALCWSCLVSYAAPATKCIALCSSGSILISYNSLASGSRCLDDWYEAACQLGQYDTFHQQDQGGVQHRQHEADLVPDHLDKAAEMHGKIDREMHCSQ